MQIIVRDLTGPERQHLAAAMLNALDQVPYFAHALFRVHPVAAEGLGTFAVDRHWRLYLDPTRFEAWTPREAGAVLAHEVGHLLREHAERARAIGSTLDHDTWNIACDAAINESLLACGTPLPDGCVTPANQGLPDNGVEEDYYRQLLQPHPPAAGGEPFSGCGSGAGDPTPDWEVPAGDPAHPGLGGTDQRIVRRMVAEDTRTAEGQHPGSVPAGLRRWAEDTLAPPTVDWRKRLRADVRRALTWAREGAADYTYTRPGRRRIPGIITPAMHSPKVNVAVVIDTSGSMSSTLLTAALGEIRGITRTTRARLTVATVDTDAQVQHGVGQADQITLTGGGGTDMRVGIEAVRTHARRDARPDVIIVLTDGYTPWPDLPTRERLIIGLVSPAGGDHQPPTPEWAQVVPITAT